MGAVVHLSPVLGRLRLWSEFKANLVYRSEFQDSQGYAVRPKGRQKDRHEGSKPFCCSALLPPLTFS